MLPLPERCRDLGPPVVLVRQPQLFIDRFAAAGRRNGFGMECGPVTYFDPAETHAAGFERPAFMKRRDFP